MTSTLFSPLPLAGRTLRNRIALPATLTNYARDGRITPRWTSFLVERARGGAGLLVSEVVAVDPNAVAQIAIVRGFDDSNAADFEATAKQVQAAGACLLAQLWHPGRQQLWHPTRSPMGVSDQPDALSWTVPHVMSEDELQAVASAYVETAARLQRFGLDGIELHGAHGYLISQLLSPWSNTRDDAFGGTRERRCRFVLDVVRGIRAACGDDFVVGLKMPATEGVPGGIDPDEAEAITTMLAAAGGLDYLAYGQGNFSASLEDHVPDIHYRPAHFSELHARMRRAAGGVPVMALGRIGDARTAERVLDEGRADLVAMSRALIADADWPNKVGRGERVRPSTFDNWCWGEVHAGRPLAELHNPQLATPGESGWRPARAARSQRVVVVGAGPAGLEAAWVAAARGHAVTLFGASADAGGKLRLEAALPGLGDMRGLIEHQLAEARAASVQMRLGERAGAATVAECSPDTIVLATGAAQREPEGITAGVKAVSARAVAWRCHAGEPATTAKRVALYDHDHTAATYAVAQALAASGAEVTLFTPRTDIARAVNHCSAIGVYRRLYAAGVNIVTAHTLADYDGETLTLRNVFSGAQRKVDGIGELVYSTPRRVDGAFAAALAGKFDVHVIGDALAPRNLMIAIHEGHHIGNAIG